MNGYMRVIVNNGSLVFAKIGADTRPPIFSFRQARSAEELL